MKDNSTEPDFSSISPVSDCSIQIQSSCPTPYSKKNGYLINNNKQKILTKLNKEDHSECIAIQKAYHERAQSDQLVIEKYQEVIKSLVSQQCKVID